jgi:toxin ParE1/3/4
MAAADDLEQISLYLQANLPAFASETVERIYYSAKSLRQFHDKGRPGRFEGTRELVLNPLPYLVIYSTSTECVHLLRIVHGAQDRY